MGKCQDFGWVWGWITNEITIEGLFFILLSEVELPILSPKIWIGPWFYHLLTGRSEKRHFKLSEPEIPHLYNGDKFFPAEILERVNDLKHINVLSIW